MNWLDALKMFGPLVLVAFPKTAPLAPTIIHAIGEAEKLNQEGADKKQIVMGLVVDAVTTTNAVAEKDVLNQEQVSAAASTAIDTVVSVINVIHDAQTKDPESAAA